MKALLWDGQRLALVERDEPRAAPGRAVVRVHLGGVCNTDLEIVRGYMGFQGTPGHEVVGTVVDGPDQWLDQRVVCEINFACGKCDLCAQGLERHCPTRTVMGILDADGGFAEYVSVPVANLHPVPDQLDDHTAVFVEPLAAAFEILEQVDVDAHTSCTVLGDGKLGLLVAQVLASTGADVVAVGKHPEKLAILAARDIRTALLEDWDGAAADVVVEATGSAAGFARACSVTNPRGTLVLKSTVADQPKLDLAPLVINEISVVGSRCGPFAPAIDALASGIVQVEPMIDARLPLARGVEAFERAAEPGRLKVLIQPAE